jgi:hypothetical protein
MKRLTALLLVIACVIGTRLHAQTLAATPQSVGAAPKAVAVGSAKKPKKQADQKDNKTPANPLFGQSVMGLNANEPTTTEIYADEAFFDSTKNMGIFSGRVKVTDPRFNLQSDKLTVFITKGESQSLEKAIDPIQTVVRQRAQLDAQTKRRTQPRLGTSNCEGPHGCRKERTCTWQQAPIPSWSSVRIVS